MPQVINIKEKDNILIVAPHPDDECIGAGGILALFPGNCRIIVLSDGREGQGDIAPEKMKEIRRAEFVNEMRAAGIKKYQMLDYEDGTLMQHTDCLEKIDLSFFSKIFVTGIHDNHPDHTAACISICNALRRQKNKWTELYLYEVHSPLQQITHILDISEVMDKKLNLIRYHQSQLEELPYDRMAKSMAEFRALQNRFSGKYMEAYTYMSPEYALDDSVIDLERRLQKSILFYWVFNRWMELKIKGHNTAEFLEDLGYHTIAVYGYAELGRLLCRELFETKIEVAYVLDKKVVQTEEGLPIYMPGKGLPKVDSVVITAVYYFDEIKKELLEMGFQNIISFRELLEREKLK